MGDLLGQRPVIIMRGQEPVVDADNVYLVVFRDIVLRGGGIQSVPATCPLHSLRSLPANGVMSILQPILLCLKWFVEFLIIVCVVVIAVGTNGDE